jgi:hypothetical protein
MRSDDEQLHWLVRPTTIRKLWIAFIALLALVVMAQSVIYIKGYFVVDGWFGFGAVYGFGCCLLMVLVAKLLGLVLKRPEDYYPVSARVPEKKSEAVLDPAESGVGESRDDA